MARDNGGPAFPVYGALTYVPDTERGGGEYHGLLGMTLRDHFAGQAVTGFLATSRTINGMDNFDVTDIAKIAYAMADAMIAERNKEPT